MDFLNSQHLTPQDGYLHVFRRPGRYEYSILQLIPGFEGSEPDAKSVIEVTDGASQPGDGVQHDVVVRWAPADHRFVVEPAELKVATNDFVLWRVEQSAPGSPPYSVRGQSRGDDVFDSRALGQHDVFTHMFMSAGEYRYSVNGQGQGRISVRDHRTVPPELADKAAEDAPLVRIVSSKPDPAELELIAGQTVVWFVDQGERVSVVSSTP